MTQIWTIGHSTRPVEELIELLRGEGITQLVDVRRYPGSRRQPQVGRETLAGALCDAGIIYVHEPGLGGRRPVARDSRNTFWREAGFRGYADYMATSEFAEALAHLESVAADGPTAIMCAEAVPWRCHRQLVADALAVRGHHVVHIIDAGRVRPHQLNRAVHVGAGGVLTYPGEPPQGSLFPGGGDGPHD